MTQNLSYFILCLIATVEANSTESTGFMKGPVDEIKEAPPETSIQIQNCDDSRRVKDLESLNKVLKVLGGSKTDPFRIIKDDPAESFLFQYLISMDQDMRTMYHDFRSMYRDLKDELVDLKSLITNKETSPKSRKEEKEEEEQKIPGRMCTLMSNNLLLASQSNSVGEVPVVKLGTFPSGTTKKHLDLNCYLQEFEGPVEVQWKIGNPPDHLLIYNISGFSEWTTETLEIGFADSENSSLDKMRHGYQTLSSWTLSPEIRFRLMSENVIRAKSLSIEWVARNVSEVTVLTEKLGEFETSNSLNESSNSLTQEWAILATPPRNRIKLSLLDLDLHNCSSCDCNQLEISSDPNFEKKVKTLCGGSLTELEYDSDTNFLFLKAGSDGVQDGAGARISFDTFTAVNLGTFSSDKVNILVMKTFLGHLELEGLVVLSWTIETQKSHIFIYEIDGLNDCESEKIELRFGHQQKFSPLSNQCVNKNLLWSWTQEDVIEFRITTKDPLNAMKISMNWTSHDISGFSGVLTDFSGKIEDPVHKGSVSDGEERKWIILATPPRNRIHLEFPSDGSFVPFDCRDFSLKMSELSGIQSKTISFCKSSPHEASYTSTTNMLLIESKVNHTRNTRNGITVHYSTLTEVDIGRFTKADLAEILLGNYMTDVEYPALVAWTVENPPNHILHAEFNGFSDCYKSTIQKRYNGGVFSSLNDKCKSEGQLAFKTLEPEVNFRLILKNESRSRNLSMHYVFVDIAEYDGHVYTEASGNISSLNYPDEYKPNSYQKWLIFSNHSKSKISLTFHDFHVEYEPKCLYDSLNISTIPRQSDSEKILCGFDLTSDLSLNTNLLTLTFTSDDGKNGRGFLLSYNIQYEIASVNLEEAPKNTSELWFKDLLENVYGPGTVTWTIENPKNKILVYYINGLQNCHKENLEIRDGSLGIISSTRSYCLDETSFASWSKQSKIEFKLNLEELQRARGMALKWTVINENDFQVVFPSSNVMQFIIRRSQKSLILATFPRNRIKLSFRLHYVVCDIEVSYDADFTKGFTDICGGGSTSSYESRTSFVFISTKMMSHSYWSRHNVECSAFTAAH